MNGWRLDLAAGLLIVAALTGCDNISFGRADIQIVPPPPADALRVEPDRQVFAELGLPGGTVLFHVRRTEGGTQVIPVAEVSGDSLRTLRRPGEVSPEAFEGRFRETVMPRGSQFELYRRGASVGTLTITGEGQLTACGVPIGLGQATTVAAAADAMEFLAFRRGLAPEVRGEYSPPQVTPTIRRYASLVAERLVLQAGLPRPRSWPGAQRDLQALEIVPGGHPEMASTYLVGDSLGVGPADPQGWSVFYIADFETRRGYQPVYSEARAYPQTGKAAPRVVDHLNWDGGEGEEILVEVYGEREAWYEALALRGNQWTKVWEGPRCLEQRR
jgi:hypothetical protein